MLSIQEKKHTSHIQNNNLSYTAKQRIEKQQKFERKVDSFFKTKENSSTSSRSWFAAAGAVLGTVASLLLFSKKQQPNVKIDSFKNFFKRLNINYGLNEVIWVGAAGMAGGIAGGLVDRNEKNKWNKIKEGSFQLLNMTIPTLISGLTINMCEKSPKFNKNSYKLLLTPLALVAGIFCAEKMTGVLDDKVFDRHKVYPSRKTKLKDAIVHLDDCFSTLMLLKFPIAEKFQANKVLPLIYTWVGFSAGDKN